MNWTGGRLSRHSGTSNPVRDRQKQHFARVQQALRSGPKKHSPIKWSFFDHFMEDRERSQRKSSAAQHRSSRAYDRQESQSSQQLQVYVSSDRNLGQEHGTRRSSRSQEPSRSGQILVPLKKKLSRVPDDDLYNATPPPRKTKRQREESIPRSEMENLADQEEEEESVSDKRRKFLRKGDWVGISIQRPLQLVFASPRKEAKIGRRRKLTEGHRARYSSKQTHITSPFLTKSRLFANQKPSQEELQRGEPARTDVRISIGGRVVPPGISSSSAPRRMGSHSTVARRRSQTTLSDVMLLDADVSITQQSPRLATSSLAARNYTASIPQIASGSQDLRPINMSLPNEVEQGDHTSYKAEGIRNRCAGIFPETASELQDDNRPSRDHFEVYQNSQETSCSPFRDYNKDCHHGRLAFSSSSASILHPAPRSSKVSALLRPASSEIAESTVAQLGKVKPVVPSSQNLENEIWETWIAPEQNHDQLSDSAYFNENRNVQRFSISPGISNGPGTWYGDKINTKGGEECSSYLPSSYSDELESGSERSNMTISALSNGRATGSSSLAQQETGIVEHTSEKFTPGVSPIDMELPKATDLNVFPDKEVIDEDQNKLWTKFLFGGNSDEVDARIPTPKVHAVPSQRGQLCITSIFGHTSGDGAAFPDVTAALQDANVPSTRSGGISRITEASPCPIGSRCRESKKETVSTTDSPSQQGSISARAERGSFLASSSDSVSASVAVQTMSQYSRSDLVEAKNPRRVQRKVTFTKPRPFIGRNTNLESLDDWEPLHIGRNLMKNDERIGPRRTRERDMRCLSRSDDWDEHGEVESIEDD